MPSRLAQALQSRRWPARPSPTAGPGAYDSWLDHFHGEQLQQIDSVCAGAGAEAYSLFAELDIDLWTVLLTKEYELYPNIRALLPDVPDPALQEIWNGVSGIALGAQTQAFYRKLTQRFGEHSGRPLRDCRALDFGCGWGRVTRFLARDIPAGRLYACDPVQEILDACLQCRVPAILARSEFVPERIPFEERFELAFAFSVFTHLSEAAHLSCLRALHDALTQDGILVLTVRPPEYLNLCEALHPVRDALGRDLRRALEQPQYLFAAHPAPPMQAPDAGREASYGEAVVTLPYMRERWSRMFQLLSVDLLVGDLYQVMLTLRRS